MLLRLKSWLESLLKATCEFVTLVILFVLFLCTCGFSDWYSDKADYPSYYRGKKKWYSMFVQTWNFILFAFYFVFSKNTKGKRDINF